MKFNYRATVLLIELLILQLVNKHSTWYCAQNGHETFWTSYNYTFKRGQKPFSFSFVIRLNNLPKQNHMTLWYYLHDIRCTVKDNHYIT